MHLLSQTSHLKSSLMKTLNAGFFCATQCLLYLLLQINEDLAPLPLQYYATDLDLFKSFGKELRKKVKEAFPYQHHLGIFSRHGRDRNVVCAPKHSICKGVLIKISETITASQKKWKYFWTWTFSNNYIKRFSFVEEKKKNEKRAKHMTWDSVSTYQYYIQPRESINCVWTTTESIWEQIIYCHLPSLFQSTAKGKSFH